MKSQIISSMLSFTLGTGATIMALSSWLGTTDLQAIKDSVVQLDSQAEGQALAFIDNYKVTVDNANAEIGEYQVALQQANDNISQLITAYEDKVDEYEDKVDELESANTKYEEDLTELEYKLSDMQVRLNQQYESDMNDIIEQANAEIQKANEEVGETKAYVDEVLKNSKTKEQAKDRIAETGKVLDTTGDKSVTSIKDIVPSKQPQE